LGKREGKREREGEGKEEGGDVLEEGEMRIDYP